jgi:hypothetical protein
MHSRLLIIAVLSLATLSACAPFKPSDKKAAVCNELNSKIIFNGSTSITREANIQQSEDAFLQHAYSKNGCDK